MIPRTLALAMLALAVPTAASAQTLGLAPFTGPRAPAIRGSVRDALEARGATVVDAEGGDVDGVVRGAITGRRASPRLALTLVDRSGAERASETARVPAGRRGARAIAAAVAALLEAAGELAPASADAAPPARAREDAAPAREAAPADAAPPPSETPGRRDARPYLHALVGLSLRNRELSVELSTGRLVHAVPLYPEVLGELRVHPLAGAGDPLLAGLRVRARFAYALFFESETPSAQVIGGAAWSAEGDLAWHVPLDEGVVELGPLLGGGFASYGLDDNAFLPTVDYGAFDARAALRIRAIDERLVIRAEAGYRLGIGSGALADAFGTPIGHGVVVEGGLEGMLPFDQNVGLSWMAALEWSHAWLGFEGNAAQELAAGGEERFVRARLGVGIATR